MKASDYIATFLQKNVEKFAFELSAGMSTHLLDSLSQTISIHIITMHYEQSASFAEEVCGCVTGIPGVAPAISGSGATNLLAGIRSCYFDSPPAVFITSQVNSHEQKGDRGIRQLAFQKADIVAIAKPVTTAREIASTKTKQAIVTGQNYEAHHVYILKIMKDFIS